MSDISSQLIKDSYNYVLQSDVSTGNIYRIGGGIPVNPIFLSGLTVNGALIATSISATTITTPFSGGSVLFAGTSGQISQDNSQLFWDDTNNRLGIGTPTPGSKLTIIGNNNIQFAGVSLQNMPAYVGTNSDDNFYAYSSGQGSGKFSTLGPPNGTSISTNSGQIAFYTGNGSITERMRINSSTGNILINTTTDGGFKLDVNGTARVSGQLTGSGNISSFTMTTLNVMTALTGSLNNIASGNVDAFLFNNTSFITSTGNSTLNGFRFAPTINQTGTATGTTRGLYINPTLTSAFDFRAIETTVGNVMLNTTGGNTLIGTTTDAFGFKLNVNGAIKFGAYGTLNGTITSNLGEFIQPGTLLASSNYNIGLASQTFIASNATMGIYYQRDSFNNNLTSAVEITGTGGGVYGDLKLMKSGGSVLIGTSTAVASSLLTMNSTTKGFLPPRMTTTQRDAIATPATGLQVYNTETNTNDYYDGTEWTAIGTGSGGGATALFNYYNFT